MNILETRLVKDASGSTGMEYALIGALISVAIVLAATTLGDNLGSLFGLVSDQVGSIGQP